MDRMLPYSTALVQITRKIIQNTSFFLLLDDHKLGRMEKELDMLNQKSSSIFFKNTFIPGGWDEKETGRIIESTV